MIEAGCRLLDALDLRRHLRGLCTSNSSPVAVTPVRDVGRGHEQVEVELTLEAFANDFHVQQSEEPAPEAEPRACDVSGS